MILYRDAHWLAVDKPTGLATHAPRPGELGAVEWLELHLGLATHIVSRLDRGTSGVLLLALDPAASARAERIHRADAATKTYEFVTTADARELGLGDDWRCDEPLDGKPATTSFRRLGALPPGSRLAQDPGSGLHPGQPLFRYEAVLARGRQHQIRRHAAAAGLPLLGDAEHGGTPWPRLCLHCREVAWPEIAAPLRAPLPPSLQALADGAADTALALALCRDRRGAWLEPVTDARRLVARDEIAGLPAAVDLYGRWLNAVWYGEEMDGHETDDAARVKAELRPWLDRLAAENDCPGGVIRIHQRNPHRRALVADSVVVGQPPPETFLVSEHDLRFEINLTRTQHTGLFLDQRDSRRRIARLARGARMANLFAFTCSFAVAAAAQAAEVVFSVDVAKACLATGKRNFAANDLTGAGSGKFIQEDARKWLRRQLRRQREGRDDRPLDLVVCDPPVFASSRDGGRFAVRDEWAFLAATVARLLAPAGTALFANNHRAGDPARYRRLLAEHFASVTTLPPPLDFPTPAGRPPHVHTFLCTHPRRP